MAAQDRFGQIRVRLAADEKARSRQGEGNRRPINIFNIPRLPKLLICCLSISLFVLGLAFAKAYWPLHYSMAKVVAQRYHKLYGSTAAEHPLLTSFNENIWELREPISFEQLPCTLVQAILAIEDTRFYSHHGLDPRGITRAALVNLQQGQLIQGGSTITQQLVKCLIGRTGRHFGDKLEEALLALVLEQFYSKQQILTAYCNTIYFGSLGPFSLYGVAAAAKHLLGKELQDLSPGDCALLAGIIRAPNSLSPSRHPAKALKRAKVVGAQMQKLGMIKESVFLLTRLPSKHDTSALIARSWYYSAVQHDIKEKLAAPGRQKKMSFTLGMDPQLQAAAQLQLVKRLQQLEKHPEDTASCLQGAVVALDVESGAIRALIGGRDYTKSSFNRALSAKRQIGSLVKPFLYYQAMVTSVDNALPFQLQSIEDRPLVLRYDKRAWRPKNFDHRFLGTISHRHALITSRNIPAVRLGQVVGLEPLSELLEELDIARVEQPKPALFLGAVDSTPLKMVAAYRTFAAGGEYVRPFLLEGDKKKVKKILDPGKTYVITDMLKGVLTEGTAKEAKKYNLPPEIAGKTGTSSELRDGWFAGYSHKLALTVWMGRDQGKPMGKTGAGSSLHPWAALMQEFGGVAENPFPVPAGVFFTGRDRIATLKEPSDYLDGQGSSLLTAGAVRIQSRQPVESYHKNDPGLKALLSAEVTPAETPHRKYRLPAGTNLLVNQKYKYF